PQRVIDTWLGHRSDKSMAAVYYRLRDEDSQSFMAKVPFDLAPLIRELWIAWIPTMMSCQETMPGLAWIEFERVHELQRFLDVVAVFEDEADSMYSRISHDRYDPAGIEHWDYLLSPLDCGGGLNGDDEEDRSVAITFTAGVYIPHPDLPTVLTRLQQHNRHRAFDRKVEAERSAGEQFA
ncbi:MAG: hypothetical protein JWO38_1061, partial [Gemmataceae bacterium]|nr:hypothetical protein [Gemmataceae bacterium]